jgi:hypothetical protein
MSGRLVAAMRMTAELSSKPSISTSSWFRVCSRSSWPPPRPAPRWRPTASISSMKMMQGAFLGLLEEVAHAACADAHEHLDEVRAGYREERHARLAGHGLGKQRLARARRAHEQHAVRDLGAHLLVALGLAQEVANLLQLLHGLVDAGHVGELDLGALSSVVCALVLAKSIVRPFCSLMRRM